MDVKLYFQFNSNSSLLSYLSSKNTFFFTDKLDDSIHIAAVKALQRMAKLKDEEN